MGREDEQVDHAQNHKTSQNIKENKGSVGIEVSLNVSVTNSSPSREVSEVPAPRTASTVTPVLDLPPRWDLELPTGTCSLENLVPASVPNTCFRDLGL